MKKKSVLELNRVCISEYNALKKIPLVVILDDVRSLNNVGSVFRTSDAFLVEHIYLCGITAAPPHPDIHKTALGAEDSVEWTHCSDVCALIDTLKNDGYTVCAIEQVHNSVALEQYAVSKDKKYAVILGNEVNGINQAAVDKCDSCIEIQQFGTKHSLNVSITSGIVIWEFFKKLYL